MWNKIIGAAIIAGVIFGIVFLIKFVPVYSGNMELESAFSECMTNFEQLREQGCRDNFARIINENKLSLDPNTITIDAEIGRMSYIKADYVQIIDVLGWKYQHRFQLSHEGKPQRRT